MLFSWGLVRKDLNCDSRSLCHFNERFVVDRSASLGFEVPAQCAPTADLLEDTAEQSRYRGEAGVGQRSPMEVSEERACFGEVDELRGVGWYAARILDLSTPGTMNGLEQGAKLFPTLRRGERRCLVSGYWE